MYLYWYPMIWPKPAQNHRKKSTNCPVGLLKMATHLLGLTSSLFEECDAYTERTGAPFEFFNCDEITLKNHDQVKPRFNGAKKRHHFGQVAL